MAISSTHKAQIWNMLNELRGKIETSEYKNYVFGLMFYKFLSEKIETYVTDNADAFDGMTYQEAYEDALAEDDVDGLFRDIQEAIGYYIQPSELWGSFIKAINENKFDLVTFIDAIQHFNTQIFIDVNDPDKRAQKAFDDIFADMDLRSNRLGSDQSNRTKTLTSMMTLVEDLSVDFEKDGDVLGDIYEYLIGMFAKESGGKAGEFYTPHQVSHLMARVLADGRPQPTKPEDRFSMYDPTMGSGSLLLTMAHELPDWTIEYYGQELNTTTYNLARMNLMLKGVDYKNIHLRNGDTLQDDWPDGVVEGVDTPRQFDAVMANPPYSLKWDAKETGREDDPRFRDYGVAPAAHADFAFMLHSLYHLKAGGRMAIVLPHGVLFRGGSEAKIREALIKNNNISAIIGLPEKIFTNTGIETVIMIVEKQRTENGVLFIDGSKLYEKSTNGNVMTSEHLDKIFEAYQNGVDVPKFAHMADTKELQENNFNLNIARYVDTFDDEEEIDLVDLQKQLAEVDAQIADEKSTLLEMAEDLKGNADVLAAIKAVFGG